VKASFKHILLLAISWLCLNSTVAAQTDGSGAGPKKTSITSERKKRKAARKEAREQRRKERAERKAIKAYHKRLQTKTVRKRMKSNRSKSKRINENKREFFLKRWFAKKKKL
jgi:hypothetical protein